MNRNNSQRNANKQCNFTDILFHQINLAKRKLAMFNLALSTSNKPFVDLIQDQHLLKNNKPSNFDKRHQILYSRTERPSAAIFALKDIPLWFNCELIDNDVATSLWITKDNNNPKIMLVSCYWDIFVEKPPKKLEKAVLHAKRHNYSLWIGMD